MQLTPTFRARIKCVTALAREKGVGFIKAGRILHAIEAATPEQIAEVTGLPVEACHCSIYEAAARAVMVEAGSLEVAAISAGGAEVGKLFDGQFLEKILSPEFQAKVEAFIQWVMKMVVTLGPLFAMFL